MTKLIRTQDPKYSILDGKLVNTVTKEPIPDDEPIFILRAKDKHSTSPIIDYLGCIKSKTHKVAVARRLTSFFEFQSFNRGNVKEPDSSLTMFDRQLDE